MTSGGAWVVGADAVHSFSVKQFLGYDLNRPSAFLRTASGQTRTVAAADATRPFSIHTITSNR